MGTKLEPAQIEKLDRWFVGQNPVSNQNLYAILDAAREAAIVRKLHQGWGECVSLYRGEPEGTLAAVAPYLVNPKPQLTRWLLDEGWGNSWGIFLFSSAGLDQLRRHLRRFLIVKSPEGKELYFRFYDPRVLRVYLPTCTAFEARQFFGPVMTYLMESENGENVDVFSRGVTRTIPVSDLQGYAGSLVDTVPPVESASNKHNGRLRIREEQMLAFSNYMNESFEKRAALHLRSEFPEATKSMTAAELNEFIGSGANRAGKHGLTRENEIAVFLDLMMKFGREFDQRMDWAVAVLQNQNLSREEKVEALREYPGVSLQQPTDEAG